MSISDLPALNAMLNGIAAAFLVTGYVLIRRGHREAHKRCMLGALTTTARGLWSQYDRHVRIARWTLWLYVSVTGVVIYLMLYQFY